MEALLPCYVKAMLEFVHLKPFIQKTNLGLRLTLIDFNWVCLQCQIDLNEEHPEEVVIGLAEVLFALVARHRVLLTLFPLDIWNAQA